MFESSCIFRSASILYTWAKGGKGVGGGGGGVGSGSEVWNRVYMIAPSKEIWPRETEYQFSFKTNMTENADMDGQ